MKNKRILPITPSDISPTYKTHDFSQLDKAIMALNSVIKHRQTQIAINPSPIYIDKSVFNGCNAATIVHALEIFRANGWEIKAVDGYYTLKIKNI